MARRGRQGRELSRWNVRAPSLLKPARRPRRRGACRPVIHLRVRSHQTRFDSRAPIRGDRHADLLSAYMCSGTARTGQGARRTTRSTVEPRRPSTNPCRPVVAMAISRAPISPAVATIVSTTGPLRTSSGKSSSVPSSSRSFGRVWPTCSNSSRVLSASGRTIASIRRNVCVAADCPLTGISRQSRSAAPDRTSTNPRVVCGTNRQGSLASCDASSATEGLSHRFRPWRACVPMTSRSHPCSWA